MKPNLTYKKARRLNAVFLLLLLATEPTASSDNTSESTGQNSDRQGRDRSPEYFENKLKEFELNKYRF